MPDFDETDAHARHIQRDIDRTREEMDHTLSELERRLAPKELLQAGAETVRERVRDGTTSTVETLKRHPLAVALGAGLLGLRFAFRPSAAERRRRRAQDDFERAGAVLAAAFERAQARAQISASDIAALTGRTIKRAALESRLVGRALGREAATYPLGALALVGIAAGLAALGRRR